MPNFNTMAEVVDDILSAVSEVDKQTLKVMPEEILSELHIGWGQTLRNAYRMSDNQELLKSTGTEHPDDASAVIIKNVWTRLQGMIEKL